MDFRDNRQKGFTLPELLAFCLVVGLMIALSLIIAHPTDYGPQRRDGERWAAISLQMRMISKYVEHEGMLPPSITKEERYIGSQADMVDLCVDLIPAYGHELTYGPKEGAVITDSDCMQEDAVYYTGFTISKTDDNQVRITAPAAETDDVITLTKKF